jgi:hypothetical protein
MKIQRDNSKRGMATLLFVALLGIMMMLIAAETRSLLHLRRETRFLEQQQIKRLNAPQTNVTAVAVSPAKSGSR